MLNTSPLILLGAISQFKTKYRDKKENCNEHLKMLGDACPRQEMIDEASGTQKEEGVGSPVEGLGSDAETSAGLISQDTAVHRDAQPHHSVWQLLQQYFHPRS